MNLIYSLNKSPSFSGEKYSLWKDKMIFLIEGIDLGIRKVMKKGPFFRKHDLKGVVANKPKKDSTKDDEENVQRNWKEKNCYHYRSQS